MTSLTAKRKKMNPEIWFLLSALAILAVFVVSAVFLLKFLISRFNLALSAKTFKSTDEVVKFDLEGAKALVGEQAAR